LFHYISDNQISKNHKNTNPSLRINIYHIYPTVWFQALVCSDLCCAFLIVCYASVHSKIHNYSLEYPIDIRSVAATFWNQMQISKLVLMLYFLCCCVECLGGDCICFVCFFISWTVDSNVDELEGEDDFEEFEEDQGQANKGKPSKLVASLILVLLIACFINIYEIAWCYIAITSR
jgi:hypothetical protein